MFNRRASSSLLSSLLALAVVALVGCGTEIVYRDREPFNPPPDAASGFLGYYTVSTKQTTCGNCHAEKQAKWAQTHHAKAWADLQASGNAAPSCNNCHTVSSNGNATTSPSGYEKVADSAYHDVQCESCHGPGLQHIEGVGQGNITVRPLASIAGDGAAVCADCHTGTHNPFAEQWAQSAHATANSRGLNATCARCHGSRGRLEAWGVQTNYTEKNTTTNLPVATCAVCHDPHGGPNEHQLRRSVSNPDPEQNLCMSCHLRVVEPETGSSRANQPHGAHGAVLLGFAGWRPPGFAYDTARIFGSHATTANPKLCAGCHVNRFTVTDQATGAFVFQSAGHQFEAVPCVDAQGVPNGELECDFTTAARNWSACTKSGCHATQTVAANVWNASKISLKGLADVLWQDLDSDQTVDVFPIDGGMLPRIKLNAPADLNPSDNVVSAADGTEFNARLCGVGLHSHEDGSYGAHNKFLCEALLAQSGTYLRSIYAFLPAPPANIQAIMDKWAGPVATGGPGQPIIKREAFPIKE
jgi:predicted CXXCH cytochrome family protein